MSSMNVSECTDDLIGLMSEQILGLNKWMTGLRLGVVSTTQLAAPWATTIAIPSSSYGSHEMISRSMFFLGVLAFPKLKFHSHFPNLISTISFLSVRYLLMYNFISHSFHFLLGLIDRTVQVVQSPAHIGNLSHLGHVEGDFRACNIFP